MRRLLDSTFYVSTRKTQNTHAQQKVTRRPPSPPRSGIFHSSRRENRNEWSASWHWNHERWNLNVVFVNWQHCPESSHFKRPKLCTINSWETLFHLRECDSHPFGNVCLGGDWWRDWGLLPIGACFPCSKDKVSGVRRHLDLCDDLLLPALALDTKAGKDGPLERRKHQGTGNDVPQHARMGFLPSPLSPWPQAEATG